MRANGSKTGEILLSSACFAAFSCLLPAGARAEQFVLFDREFTFTKEMADAAESPSHYYVRDLNPARPSDWTAPVDYRHGTVHIRTEVIDKPAGDEITQWVLCYIGDGAYGCTGSGTYTREGLVERDESMTDWWQNETIDWTRGISEMHLVLKDQDDSQGFANLRPDFAKFFPTTVRITMVQVSEGDSYDPSLIPDGSDTGEDAGAAPEVDGGTPSSTDDGGLDGGTDDDNPNADGDMSDSNTNGNAGSGTTGGDESIQGAASEDSSGCSVGTMGTAASPHVGVMAMGLSALIVRANRRRKRAQPG